MDVLSLLSPIVPHRSINSLRKTRREFIKPSHIITCLPFFFGGHFSIGCNRRHVGVCVCESQTGEKHSGLSGLQHEPGAWRGVANQLDRADLLSGLSHTHRLQRQRRKFVCVCVFYMGGYIWVRVTDSVFPMVCSEVEEQCLSYFFFFAITWNWPKFQYSQSLEFHTVWLWLVLWPWSTHSKCKASVEL